MPEGRYAIAPSFTFRGETITLDVGPLLFTEAAAVARTGLIPLMQPLRYETLRGRCGDLPGTVSIDPVSAADRIAERIAVRQPADAAEASWWQLQRELYETEMARQRREREAADTVARRQLERCLTAGQREQLQGEHCFRLVSNTGRSWQVGASGQSGNVALLDAAGFAEAIYCAHPAGNVPDPAAWLAQLLWLTSDEAGFLAVANCEHPHDGYLPAGYSQVAASVPVTVPSNPVFRVALAGWYATSAGRGSRHPAAYHPAIGPWLRPWPRPPCYRTPLGQRVHVLPSCRCRRLPGWC
jgi:hypothetical protein